MKSLLVLCVLLVPGAWSLCRDYNVRVNIAVVWDGKEPKTIEEGPENREWELVKLFAKKWPDSFKSAPSRVYFQRNREMCYRPKKTVVLVKQDADLNFIHDESIRRQLANTTIIFGQYIRAVGRLAAENGIPYIVTAPVSTRYDPQTLGVRNPDTTLFMWPSWSDVARAVSAFLTGEDRKRVLLLYNHGSDTARQVADVVHTQVTKTPSVQFSFSTVIRFPDIPRPPARVREEQKVSLDTIYRLINQKNIDTVLVFFDNEEPMWLLNQFFVEGRNLDREDLWWLLIDQTTIHNSKTRQLEDVRVLKAPIYTIVPSAMPRYRCDSWYDGTNKIGADDGVVALREALETRLHPSQFSRRSLYEALLNTTIVGQAPYSMDPRILNGALNLAPKVTLGWSLLFNESTHTKRDFEMQVRHLLPDVNVYGRHAPTCGLVTSLWFSGAPPAGIANNYEQVSTINRRDEVPVVGAEVTD